MATTTDTGFSRFDAPALPGLTGLSLALRVERLMRRLMSPAAVPGGDALAGPGFAALTPGLSQETSRR